MLEHHEKVFEWSCRHCGKKLTSSVLPKTGLVLIHVGGWIYCDGDDGTHAELSEPKEVEELWDVV